MPKRDWERPYLTFIGLLDVEEFRGSGVLGAFVVLLIGVENDGQGSVAFSYLILRSGAWQIEHGTGSNVSHERDRDPLDSLEVVSGVYGGHAGRYYRVSCWYVVVM